MHSLSKLTVKATGDGRLIVAFYALTVVLVSILKLTLTEGAFNNFDIFRYSFLHLLEGKDLYAAYPEVYFDLYKYSPGFSLFMAPFWYLERTSALVLWNLLNAVFPVYMLGRMNFSVRERWFFALFILFEMITSIQNAQSNGLMLALMMWAFDARENNNIRVFALAVALGVSIKLFAAVVVLLLFFQDNKTKWLIYSAVSGVVLLLLPAFITGFQPLWQLYISWFNLLINDAPHALNYSLMAFFERVFGLHLPNIVWLAVGVVLLFLPLLRKDQYPFSKWRLTWFALMLVWVVLFNHKTESPTFVIAMAGAALYYLGSPKTTDYKVLMVIVFIFTGLAATDIFPRALREDFIKPYAIKVLPCIILFIYILKDLLFSDFGNIHKQLKKST